MTRLARLIDTHRCMGCRSCLAACYTENFLTPNAQWNVMMEYEVGRYPDVRTQFSTMNCMHCEHPSCKVVCDHIGVHAISKNEFGVVLIDYEKCIGCKYCAAVCPYGAPQYDDKIEPLYPQGKTPYEAIPYERRHPTHRKRAGTVEKCTFCWHKLEKAVEAGKTELIGEVPEYTPTCDLVCPVGARMFGDIDDPDSTISRRMGEKKATQIKKEYGTRPQVYYVSEGGDF